MLADLAHLATRDITLVANGVLTKVHPATLCAGRNCWIHNPSKSAVSSFPVVWRTDTRTAERICSHNVGHPDLDDVAYNASKGRDTSIHGCCSHGCC